MIIAAEVEALVVPAVAVTVAEAVEVVAEDIEAAIAAAVADTGVAAEEIAAAMVAVTAVVAEEGIEIRSLGLAVRCYRDRIPFLFCSVQINLIVVVGRNASNVFLLSMQSQSSMYQAKYYY